MSLSVMQEVFTQFPSIYRVNNVALMVVESSIAFCLSFLPMLNDSLNLWYVLKVQSPFESKPPATSCSAEWFTAVGVLFLYFLFKLCAY